MRLSPFRPQGTLGTGGTHRSPPYPGDWRDSTRFSPQVPLGLAGLIPFFPRVSLGLAGLSNFGPSDTLETGHSNMTGAGESLSPKDWYWCSDKCFDDISRSRSIFLLYEYAGWKQLQVSSARFKSKNNGNCNNDAILSSTLKVPQVCVNIREM